MHRFNLALLQRLAKEPSTIDDLVFDAVQVSRAEVAKALAFLGHQGAVTVSYGDVASAEMHLQDVVDHGLAAPNKRPATYSVTPHGLELMAAAVRA